MRLIWLVQLLLIFPLLMFIEKETRMQMHFQKLDCFWMQELGTFRSLWQAILLNTFILPSISFKFLGCQSCMYWTDMFLLFLWSILKDMMEIDTVMTLFMVFPLGTMFFGMQNGTYRISFCFIYTITIIF